MMRLKPKHLILAFVGFISMLLHSDGFSAVQQQHRIQQKLSPASASSRKDFGRRALVVTANDGKQRSMSKLFADTSSNSDNKEEVAATPSGDGGSEDSVSEAENEEKTTSSKNGIVMAFLIGIPLFIKFVIVLSVKFLTDVVVFPILFLYRRLKWIKRKILALVGGVPKEKVNGEGMEENEGGSSNSAAST